jgi:hypothetical protein
MQAVHISWHEHYSDDGEDNGGWCTQEHVEALAATSPPFLETVAWLLKETKTHWIVSDTLTPDGTYGRIWGIAKSAGKCRKLKT